MSADDVISQIHTWIDEANPDHDVEVCLGLPDFDWVEVRSLSDHGAMQRITYRRLATFSRDDVEMICPRDAFRACRRRPTFKPGALFGDRNADDAPAETGASS